jgi:HAD superfamily hydrolase (TIGR01450 family)
MLHSYPDSRPAPRPRPNRYFDAYVFDLDGTIYLGDGLLPGAKRLIEELRRRRLPVRFLSNNPTKDPAQYAHKLAQLGLVTPIDEIANTVVTMTRWLTACHPDAVIFPIAEPPLQRALQAAGFRLSDDPTTIDIVIASYDRTFDYRKLQIAFDALYVHRRAILVTTNPDRFCPFPGGRGEPDAAAITAAIEACTGVTCVKNVGKPDPAMLDQALTGTGVAPGDCVMVGDRIHTDMQMALDTGATPALVLTGETTAREAADLLDNGFPGFVLDRIDHLIPASDWPALGWSGIASELNHSPDPISRRLVSEPAATLAHR